MGLTVKDAVEYDVRKWKNRLIFNELGKQTPFGKGSPPSDSAQCFVRAQKAASKDRGRGNRGWRCIIPGIVFHYFEALQ